MHKYRDYRGEYHEKPDGAEVTWRISTYALIRREDGRILMVMPFGNPQWQFPGGGIEMEETLPEAVRRECWEETGYKVGSVSEVPLRVGETRFYLEGHYHHSLYLIVRAELEAMERDAAAVNSVEPDEIEKVEWKSLDELDEANVHRVIWPTIDELKKA